MNSSRYHYTAVTKPNALIAKFLSKHDKGRFCLNVHVIFKQMKNLNNIKSNVKITITLNWQYLKSLKLLNKETDKQEKVPGNILKHLLQDKSMQLIFSFIYDF